MIFKSQQPDIDLPETDLTSVVFGRVDELGEKPALIEGTTGRTLTYNQLREQTSKFSAGLNERGFKKGDVMAILFRICLSTPLFF